MTDVIQGTVLDDQADDAEPAPTAKRCTHDDPAKCEHDCVEFMGKRFEISAKLALAPMIRLAQLAKRGLQSAELESMAAMGDLIESSLVDAAEFDRFMDHATQTRADDEEIMSVVEQVYEVITERPTTRRSDASSGPSTTSPNSTDDESSLVIRRYESEGRSDIALLITEKVEARRAS